MKYQVLAIAALIALAGPAAASSSNASCGDPPCGNGPPDRSSSTTTVPVNVNAGASSSVNSNPSASASSNALSGATSGSSAVIDGVLGGSGGAGGGGGAGGQGGDARGASSTTTVTYSSSSEASRAAYAPGVLNSPTAPCRIAIGGSAGWLGGAIGFGGSTLDEGCDLRETSRHLSNLGLKEASVQVMCLHEGARKALEAAGVECKVQPVEK